MTAETKFTLTEDRIPTHWVNLLPDLPGEPLPPLNPGTMEPAGPDDLTPIFPMELIGQEVSMEPEVEIPEQVREVYRLWRPTPLYRAHRLERALDTPARIYYKLAQRVVADSETALERENPPGTVALPGGFVAADAAKPLPSCQA